jgi:hypothetical protein
VAPEIVNGLFYAVLALVVGVGIVAIGGGGIAPMRERWQRALTRLDAEAPRLRQEARGGTEVVREKMDEVRREVGAMLAASRRPRPPKLSHSDAGFSGAGRRVLGPPPFCVEVSSGVLLLGQ